MRLKVKAFVTLLLIFRVVSSMAAPALRIPYTITLRGGETLQVVKCGDEHRHWLQTPDGSQLVIADADGLYHIATEEEREGFFSRPVAKVRSKHRVEQFSPSFPTTGEMRSLVILVNFEDKKFLSPTARNDFQRMMTQEGYSELGGTGSARDYYIENSMGLFKPQFDVVGPVNLLHSYKYYGENDATGDDARAEDMIIDACRALDDEVDFTQYDFNNDGYIDNVFVFYAGYGEATTSDANTIWPHSYDITECTSIPIMLDGKRLDHYACTNELSRDGVMDGIGTFVHEFGHVLGLPDLYPTQNTNAFTPNIWSVMDEGEYNNNSRTPPYFTAYERLFLGWLTPIEVLKDGCSLAISHIADNEAYIIRTAQDNEYFLLENRQQRGWDAYIPGHGMLVWHIDYDPYLWDMNRVNNISTHQYVDIVEADGLASSGTKGGDPFPGLSNVTSYTATTTPAFVDWKGVDVGCPLTNIREENGIILLDAAGGGAPLEAIRYIVPVADMAEELTATSFLASWQRVDEAEGYYFTLGKMAPGADLQDVENFDGGVSGMHSNWVTNVISTYSNANYAGALIPSLRLQKAGDFIRCERDGIKGVSFWCRGSSVKAGTMVEVRWQTSDGTIVHTDYYPLTTTGTTVSYPAPEDENVAQITIVYSPAAGSGSLAIDDIAVSYSEMEFQPIQSEVYTTETQLLVTDLMPDTPYAYYVVAARGILHSRHSNIIQLRTLQDDEDGMVLQPATTAPAIQYYDLLGRKVNSSYKGLKVSFQTSPRGGKLIM